MGTAVHHIHAATHQGRFMVGRDARGRWVVRDEKDLVGGLFVDRASAVRFAMFESDYVPGAVCCVPDGTLSSLEPAFDSGQAADLLKQAGSRRAA